MSGRITVHVLDTATGRPAAGMVLRLARLGPDGATLGNFLTNADGRCDGPLLEGAGLRAGLYELVFEVGQWRGDGAGFYDSVPIRFRIDDPGAHYHVPLLIAPFGYSTYRGS